MEGNKRELTKKDLLTFIYLALTTPFQTVRTEKQLIKVACQMGGKYKVTEAEISKVINIKLVDFL